MAAVNLIAVANTTLNSFGLALTASAQDLIAAIATSHAAMVDSIYVSNVDGTVAETCTITVVKAVGPVTTEICKVVSVPAGATLVVVSKGDEINLIEADKIQALAGSASKLKAFASWKDVS